MRLYSGARVKLESDTYGVPDGSVGQVVAMDYGDTDFYTYEVAFDCGIVLKEVRVYHLKLILGGEII